MKKEFKEKISELELNKLCFISNKVFFPPINFPQQKPEELHLVLPKFQLTLSFRSSRAQVMRGRVRGLLKVFFDGRPLDCPFRRLDKTTNMKSFATGNFDGSVCLLKTIPTSKFQFFPILKGLRIQTITKMSGRGVHI